MNNKSIDGLQRRSGTKTARINSAASKKRATVKTNSSLSVNKKVTKRKTIGITDGKKDLKKVIAENERLDRERKTSVQSDESVKEYLSAIQDIDPTDLVEVPRKEKSKAWYKDKLKNKKADKPKKKHKIVKRVAIAVVLILVVGIGALYFYLNDFVSTVTDNGNILNVIFSDPDTPLEKDENGRTNILVFGTEGYAMDDPNYDGGFLTDAMMILSVNQDSGDVKAVSLPRDLKMQQTCTATMKMNEVYWCEYLDYLDSPNKTNDLKKQKEDEGGTALAKKFEEVTGLKVHYRVHVNWAVLIDTINTLDGVDVCFYYQNNKCPEDVTAIEVSDERGLSEQSYNNVYFAYETNKKYHLVGYQALEVARARNASGGYGALNGNFSREYFQQRIIEATARKAKEKKITIETVLKLKQTMGDNIRTNFKDTELKTLVKLVATLNTEHLETISLTEANLLTTSYINGISYVVPAMGTYEYDNIKSYLKTIMRGEDYITENASIVVLNGTDASGIASNEKNDLEDEGFTVNQIANSPDEKGLSDFDGIKIYQVDASAKKTAAALKKRYKAEMITEIPESLKIYDCDFIIILGNGYDN